MTTFIIFLLLTLIEFLIVCFKWDDVTDAHEIGKIVSSSIGIREKYDTIIESVILFLKRLKPLLWLISIVVLLVNFFAALLLSGIYQLIIYLVNHFF